MLHVIKFKTETICTLFAPCLGLYYRINSILPQCKKEGNDQKGALAIRRIFSLVDMITKPNFSNCHKVFKIGLFR